MAVEVAIVALIGASVSVIEPRATTSKTKLVRKFFAGFFLAFFAGQDAAELVQHVFSFKVSEGGTIFFTAYIGSAFLERVILLMNAFSVTGWSKK